MRPLSLLGLGGLVLVDDFDEPLQAVLQALTRLGRARLDLPLPVPNRVQVQAGRDLQT